MARLPLVLVLIPTRNNADELILCLESLRDLKYPKDRMELLVFDNGSTDKTPERVQELFIQFSLEGWARLALERSPRNLGAFGGRAEALQRALGPGTDFILSLDDDVELDPDALTFLLEVMDDTRVGMAGARVVYHDAPDEVATGAGYLNRWLGTYYHTTPRSRTACDFVSSCGFLIRRTALEAVGGFDRDYFTSHGDVDICLKIRTCGYEVFYEPAAVIRHKVARGGTRSPERIYYLYRNKLLLLRKHLPWWWRPAVFALYAVFWVPKALVSSLGHHREIRGAEMKAILLAMIDAVADRRGQAKWFSTHSDA
jgi:GT2 family glycosyltransferase